jgi:hypothetical protein
MRYIPNNNGLPNLELTRRNLVTLLAKLDDPASARTLIDPDRQIMVIAVENAEHYSTRPPGEVVMPSTREVINSIHLPMAFYPGGDPWVVSADTACGARMNVNNVALSPDVLVQVDCPRCLGLFALSMIPLTPAGSVD